MQIMCLWAFCDERAILWFHPHSESTMSVTMKHDGKLQMNKRVRDGNE